ncbi:hypothetical protein BGX38DRAFT_1140753 [Terfezia claveryi]|nr:hypothetical protein BGX38DRAFT_1140753 [Terfezia claveryi]
MDRARNQPKIFLHWQPNNVSIIENKSLTTWLSQTTLDTAASGEVSVSGTNRYPSRPLEPNHQQDTLHQQTYTNAHPPHNSRAPLMASPAGSTQSPPVSSPVAPTTFPSPPMASTAAPTRLPSPPVASSATPTRLPSPSLASAAGHTESPPMESSASSTEPPSMASPAGPTKSPPPRRSAPPRNEDPFPNDFELYALPPAKTTRFTDSQIKRLNHLVFTLGCVEGRKNNEWAIEEIWMVIPKSRGGGAELHLTVAQIIQFIRVWAKQVPEKHLRMAKFYKWIEQQPESEKPWLSERDLAAYCRLTFPHMHAREREVLEQRKVSMPDVESQVAAACGIEGSIRVDVSARTLAPAVDNALNPTAISPSDHVPGAAILLPNTPTTRSRATASSARQSPALARLSLPPPGVAPQDESTRTPIRSRTTGAIAAVLATAGPSEAALPQPSVHTPTAARFRATGPTTAEAPASNQSPPSRFRAVKNILAETPAGGSPQIITSSPPSPTDFPPSLAQWHLIKNHLLASLLFNQYSQPRLFALQQTRQRSFRALNKSFILQSEPIATLSSTWP